MSLKDQTVKNDAINRMAAMSSAQIVSATAIHNRLGLAGIPRPTLPGAAGVRNSKNLPVVYRSTTSLPLRLNYDVMGLEMLWLNKYIEIFSQLLFVAFQFWQVSTGQPGSSQE